MKMIFSEKAQSVEWYVRSFDMARAESEGWFIEYDCGTGARLRGCGGKSDLDAWWHVAQAAARGSAYHCAALAELAPDERLALEVYCGPTGTPPL